MVDRPYEPDPSKITIELPSEQARQREQRVRSDFWPKLKRVARRIPFAEDAVAAYYCALDPQSPTRVRAVLLGALAYFIMPADIVPDLLPGLGFTDDAAVLAYALKTVADHIRPEHRDAAQQALAEPKEPRVVSG
jgi:uncharacterized membrane protein YkvA (DUF1232 family)